MREGMLNQKAIRMGVRGDLGGYNEMSCGPMTSGACAGALAPCLWDNPEAQVGAGLAQSTHSSQTI